jgi:periplasmic divalent cation tolerance protein
VGEPKANTNCVLCLCTFPNAEEANTLGRKMVEEKRAACVNLLTGVHSIYRWQGAVEEGGEVLAIFKTTAEAVDSLQQRLLELHSYEVPEFVVLPISSGSKPYLDWIRGALSNSEA